MKRAKYLVYFFTILAIIPIVGKTVTLAINVLSNKYLSWEKSNLLLFLAPFLLYIMITIAITIWGLSRRGQTRKHIIVGVLSTLISLGVFYVSTPFFKRVCILVNERCMWGNTGILRSLPEVQNRFQSNRVLDQDQDGRGEFGLLNEFRSAKLLSYPKELGPPTSAGYTMVFGYYIQIFLPHKGKVLTDANTTRKFSADFPSIDAQEQYWIAYAWPVKYGETGFSCFVINQSYEIYQIPNRDAEGNPIYEGSNKTPSYNAAMYKIYDKQSVSSLHWTPIASGKSNAVDGQLWLAFGAG